MMDETLKIFSEKEKACLRGDWEGFHRIGRTGRAGKKGFALTFV